ncbi:MAG: hypothetical protein IPI67_25570 [Myxococcales bacterium]|nr:hypothetical protein [Myxococcales bacterium]
MTDPELFKYDVRIRERLMRRGLVNDADVTRHLEGLVDSEAKSETLPQAQPALGQNDPHRASPVGSVDSVDSVDEEEDEGDDDEGAS